MQILFYDFSNSKKWVRRLQPGGLGGRFQVYFTLRLEFPGLAGKK
jgi:hypothetical protein